MMSEKLRSNTPFCAGKFGSTECVAMALWSLGREIPANLEQGMKYVAGMTPLNFLGDYTEYTIKQSHAVDFIAPWNHGKNRGEELLYSKMQSENWTNCELRFLDPLVIDDPWSRDLAGKRVLVLTPFADSASDQLDNHESWDTTQMLASDADYTFLKTRYSIHADDNGYDNYMHELYRLTADVQSYDFDVALIGCGSIGFPLAMWIKNNLKKTAIHTGGATQLIFGLIGGRWESSLDHLEHFNEHWIRPYEHEHPSNKDKFVSTEGPCYF